VSELIRDDPAWWYVAQFNGLRAVRRLRVWRVGPGRLVAVLTERGDGPSITNAVGDIQRRLIGEYPDDVVDVVEHYPPEGGGCRGEHFDLVLWPRFLTAPPGKQGQQSWRALPLPELVKWIGCDPSEQAATSA
jgi:hypothetical protein